MIRPLIGGGSSNCKAKDENVGRRRCRHLLCPCSDNSLKAIDIIQKHGGEAYLVGGCVRDMVLKEKPHDEDLTTSLTPDKIVDIFESEGYKVLPTGLQHGTVTVMMDGEGYEITTFRKETTYSDNRHPDSVTFSSNIEDDCSRRDFTFNAMYYDGKQIIDTYHGQKDIEDRVIRTVGNPDERFNEDALRMLRAVRFSSKLDFEIAPEVQDAIERNRELIRNISAERIQAEITKTLAGPNRRYAFDVMRKTGLLKEVLPELDNLKSVRQNPKYHYEDAYEHTMTALENTPDDISVRYAVLFHDLGKATVQQVDDKGVTHFVGHEADSGRMADEICSRLKMSTEDRKRIVRLVTLHNCPASPNMKPATRFMVKNQDMSDDDIRRLQAVWKADWDSHKFFSEEDRANFKKFNDRITLMLKGPHRIKDLKINGDDLIEQGYKPGPEIKDRLDRLLTWVISTNTVNKEKYWTFNPNTKKGLLKQLKIIESEIERANRK